VDCTAVTVILRKRFDSLCFWTFRVLSGLAEPAYAGPVYTGIISGVLQIPQYVAGKGTVRKILGMPNSTSAPAEKNLSNAIKIDEAQVQQHFGEKQCSSPIQRAPDMQASLCGSNSAEIRGFLYDTGISFDSSPFEEKLCITKEMTAFGLKIALQGFFLVGAEVIELPPNLLAILSCRM